MAQIKLAEYTFNNSVGDCLPTLTPNTITMTKEDSVNGTTTKRIIYIDNATLPTRIRFGTDGKSDGSLLTVDYLDIDTNITSMEKMFSGCAKLTYVNTTNWNTTNVTNMYHAFGGTSISEINVTSFNTDKVTNMDYMFGNCLLLRFIDITNFTTRSDMSTGSMFANGNIKVIYDGNKWKSFMSMAITSTKVTPPEHIIAKYKYDTSITSSVTKPTITGISSSSIVIKEVTTGVDSINYVIIGYDGTEQPITKISFFDFKSLSTIEYLNIDSNINKVSNMFQNCTNLTSINTHGWNTTTVTDMSYMFNDCSSLTSLDLSSFDTTNTTNMTSMFYGCTGITTLDLTNFDTTKITSSSSMFSEWTSSQSVYIGKKWTIDTSSYSANFIRLATYLYTLAKYTFNNSVAGCLPTITGATTSQWGYSDVVDGNITTRTIGTDDDNLKATSYSFNGQPSLLSIEYLKIDSNITTLENLFSNCANLTYINTTDWDVSNVQSTYQMCYESRKLTSIDLSYLNFAKVQSMSYMFSWCVALKTVGSNSFIAKPTDTSNLFHNCSALQSLNLSMVDTSLTVNMGSMFNNCSRLTSLDVSNFDTSAVTNMRYMFAWCVQLTSLDLKNFNTRLVTDSNNMFYEIEDIDVYIGKNWTIDVSSYKDINFIRLATYLYTLAKYTFNNSVADCLPTITGATTSQWGYNDKIDGTTTTRIIGTDDINVKPTAYNFNDKTSLLSIDYIKIDSNVTSLYCLVRNCTSVKYVNTQGWDVSNVTTCDSMCSGASALPSIDLSNLNFTKPVNFQYMFQNCTKLTEVNTTNFKASPTIIANMFRGCSSLTTLDLSNLNTSAVSNMSNMFYGCSSLTSLNTSTWNTSAVTNMSSMFQNCSALTTLDLSHFNVDSVTNMYSMFNSCRALTSLNTSTWNTSEVTNMYIMFQNCVKLTTLDLSHFNVKNVTNIGGMFTSCSALTTVDLSTWNTSKVTNMLNMFHGCNKLVSLDLSNFDTSKVTEWGSLSGANKLTDIGLVYASSSTINSIVTNWLGTSIARNVYYMDAEPSELTTRANITYVPYSQSILSCREEITLRSNGDVYDELDLLTGQLIQRIGEDNEILEEEIIRTVELDGEISFYENSYIRTSSNEITPEFEFQPTLTNCYVVSDLKPNTQYTVLFEGSPTLMSLGGTTIENPISKIMITSGEVDNILWFDTSVSKTMILEGDLTNRDVEYFTGVKSSQKIQVQLRGEGSPIFGEGGRK